MSLKRMVLGEQMPSRDDPKYKERYEKEKRAGMKFAEKSGINFLAARLQMTANKHRIGFLATVFTIVIGCFTINVVNLVKSYKQRSHERITAVEKVDSALHKPQHNN